MYSVLLGVPAAILIAARRPAAVDPTALVVCRRNPIPAGIIVPLIFAGWREIAGVTVLVVAPIITLANLPI